MFFLFETSCDTYVMSRHDTYAKHDHSVWTKMRIAYTKVISERATFLSTGMQYFSKRHYFVYISRGRSRFSS